MTIDAQAILDAASFHSMDWESFGHEAIKHAEAVLVAARDHDTRQAKAIQLLESILDRHKPYDRFDVDGQPLPKPGCSGCPWPISWPCETHADAVAALDLLDKAGEGRSTDWIAILDPLLGGAVPTETRTP